MRNLKRALSLALASVMLLGMMVVGTSAAFTDSDQIVNTEAVEITAGLGLFAGNPDGSFNPKGTVTRAQMATVIAKMLYGSDVDADAYKGSGKFSDVANFEGGWAEGYVNICAGNNIISGYPDGTFKPGQAVTTAEASVMIIKALKVEIPAGEWPTNVMIKADEMELFDELAVKPGANVALNRDQLASIVWEGMDYSADGVQGYSVTKDSVTREFKTWGEAFDYLTAITPAGTAVNVNSIVDIKGDTLAKSVFGITAPVTGYITENQATGAKYTKVGDVKVDLETGLDMLGHYVTVYYKEAYQTEAKPGVAYCIVEAADYVTVSEQITDNRKDFLAAFGSKVEDEDTVTAMTFDGADGATATYAYNETAYTAAPGTYVIDKESGKIRAFIAPVSYTVGQVSRINTLSGKESIKIGTAPAIPNNEDQDLVVEYEGIAKDDVVIVKEILDVTYLEKAQVVSGKITKNGTVDKKAATYIDGKAYINAGKALPTLNDGKTMVATANPSNEITYDAYIYGDKLLGLVETSGSVALTDAIYVVNYYSMDVADMYGTKTHYYAQGIDANGKEVTILIGIQGCTDGTESVKTSIPVGNFYTFEKVKNDKEQAKKDIMAFTAAKNEAAFNKDADKFFANAATVAGNALNKDTKSITANGETVYLTAETKFVVVDNAGFTLGTAKELKVNTYTGTISKNVAGESVMVAATIDDDDNYLAQVVVISGSASLKAEDYIFVVDGSDYALVEDGREYKVFFTATNEFGTIVAKDVATAAGFYGDYEIEDGVYDLGAPETSTSIVLSGATVDGIMNTSIKIGATLYEAKDAKVFDIRSEEDLDNTEIEIESLNDIINAKRADYKITFKALVDTEEVGEETVTHIFVTGIEIFNPDTEAWEKA